MPFNIGVNVVEVDGSAAPTIVAAPISVAGFLARTQRGIPNLAVPISGFSDFVNNFGSYTADAKGNLAYTAFAVRGFFDNGGTQAYVVRIVDPAAIAANMTLLDRAGGNALQVQAGLRGSVDPGNWGNSLAVSIADHPRGSSFIPAQIIGLTTAAEPFALTDGELLEITANGVDTKITFKAANFANIGAATASEIATAINRQTTALVAGVTPDRHLMLASTASGTTKSRLVVTAGTAATTLGFTGASANGDSGIAAGSTQIVVQGTGGLLPGSAVRLETRGYVLAPNAMATSIPNKAGINVTVDGGSPPVSITFKNSDFARANAITPVEVVAAINRQARGFSADLTTDNHLVLLSNTYGTKSSIGVAAGTPDATAALGLTGNTPVAGLSESHTLSAVSETYKFVTLGEATTQELPSNSAHIQSAEFDLIVSRLDASGTKGTEIERFESLSMQSSLDYYAVAVVNNQASGSRYFSITNKSTTTDPGQRVPAASTTGTPFFPLVNGSDGNTPADTDYIGDPALRTGLYAFDPVSIQLLTCPETTSTAVVQASMGYCENRGDLMFVGTAPRGFDLAGIKTYASSLKARKVYGALYAPWIQVVNPVDTTGKNPAVWIPPVGHVLGTYARIGDARGVWKAPAGDEAQLINALGVEFDMTDVDHTDLVKNGSVNGIRAIPGSGIIVDASRTLSTDTRWLFVNVRRLFNFVKSSLRDGLRFVAQEPNTTDLQRAINFNVIRPFLLDLWQRGAFGSDPPEQVFTIICDATNNPPSQVNLGNLTVEVYFYPVKPAETIIIIVGQQESGAQTSEG